MHLPLSTLQRSHQFSSPHHTKPVLPFSVSALSLKNTLIASSLPTVAASTANQATSRRPPAANSQKQWLDFFFLGNTS